VNFLRTWVLFIAAKRISQLPITLDVQSVYCGVLNKFMYIILLNSFRKTIALY
jgi:hypothetical protein